MSTLHLAIRLTMVALQELVPAVAVSPRPPRVKNSRSQAFASAFEISLSEKLMGSAGAGINSNGLSSSISIASNVRSIPHKVLRASHRKTHCVPALCELDRKKRVPGK
jgi:hypothetical protein